MFAKGGFDPVKCHVGGEGFPSILRDRKEPITSAPLSHLEACNLALVLAHLQKSELPMHHVWQHLTQDPVKCSWEELDENAGLKTLYAPFSLDIADINMDDESLYSCQCIYPSAKPAPLDYVWCLSWVTLLNFFMSGWWGVFHFYFSLVCQTFRYT